MLRPKDRFLAHFKAGLGRGAGFFVGFASLLSMTVLLAQSVTTFNSGEILTAAALNDNFSSLDDEIAMLQSDLATLTTTVTGIDTTVTGLGTTVTGLNTTVTGLNTTVTGLNTTVTGLNTTVTGLSTTVTGLDTTVNGATGLQTRMDSPLPRVVSVSSGSFVNNSTTETDVLSVTVTTAGSPVWLGLMSDGSGLYCGVGVSEAMTTGSTDGELILLRDAVEIARWKLSHKSGGANDEVTYNPCSSIWHIDNPPAGTYTYRLRSRVIDDGVDRVHVTRTVLTAFRFNET